MTIPLFKVKTRMNKREVMQAVDEAKMQPLKKCAALVEAEMKDLLNTPGATGDVKPGEPGVYYNKDLKRYTKASEPGQPPHRQTGDLFKGVESAPTGNGTYVVGIIQQVFYGKFHEWGERPFARVALLNVHRQFRRLFRRMRLDQTAAGRYLKGKRRGNR